jgi:CRISPR-associated endonuclease/helicase Cas3
MATANAMFGRLEAAYRRLFAPGQAPSLALAHGRAGLHPGFAAAISEHLAEEAYAAPGEACEPAGAQCAAWLADDRRRALLAEVGVGTIDQALLAVLAVRHATLRLHGLMRKVLIVDEAHAFDAYMNRELVALLRFQAALGGSAILLSATLPQALRQRLADAWRDGLALPPAPLAATHYPLASAVGAGSPTETPCATRAPRRVRVTRLDDEAAAIARIRAAVAAGAAVAWVRNTVDGALAGAAALRPAGLAPLVFHARYAMVDRLARESEVLGRFGRTGSAANRRGVLVATQVIEQSLDLDFDLVVSDLAPVDLLIQRAGRLWRHMDLRPRASRPVDGPELLVVSPPPVDDPAPDWIAASQPGTAAVYGDPALLWRSARALFAAGAIVVPEGVRALIEAAADEDATPAGLRAAEVRALGKKKGEAAVAGMNVLDFAKGYAGQTDAWASDVVMPTRLERVEEVTLRLARVMDGEVVPYAQADTLMRAWALSEVRVAKHGLAACPLAPALAAAAQRARDGWGRWEREAKNILLAVLSESGALAGENAREETVSFQYDSDIGLTVA